LLLLLLLLLRHSRPSLLRADLPLLLAGRCDLE
jgi:hypothetical protein